MSQLTEEVLESMLKRAERVLNNGTTSGAARASAKDVKRLVRQLRVARADIHYLINREVTRHGGTVARSG